MLFHRRQHAQFTLHLSGVVIMDIGFNHLDKFTFTGETPAVIAFPLQNAPETLQLLYFTVERISLARQMRSTRLSLTWMPQSWRRSSLSRRYPYPDFPHGAVRVFPQAVHSPQSVGSASRKPICGKPSVPHGAAHRECFAVSETFSRNLGHNRPLIHLAK